MAKSIDRFADDLINEAGVWTQFAAGPPDGTTAIVLQAWENPQNAALEEEHKTFRFEPDQWRIDSYLVDLKSGRSEKRDRHRPGQPLQHRTVLLA